MYRLRLHRLRSSSIVRRAAGLAALALAIGLSFGAREPQEHRGRFGLTRLDTADGERASLDGFFPSSDCALCHPRQWNELSGSLHSVSHHDPLYRAFAELARKEAGPEVYASCSGCHSPAGVASGLIPDVPEERLPEDAKAGVTCDVCHQVDALSGAHGPWKEEGNASLVLRPGRTKFGPFDDIARNPAHSGAARDFFRSSEFCAACHTVIHPTNGLFIEHTYDEWKRSVYAEKGIQCQDCHMRSVEDAIRVARTLEPVEVRGRSATKGEERRIAPHFFVGGNVDADVLARSTKHADMAEARLKSAAELAIEVAPSATAQALAFDVIVTNVGAGHALPTSLTELREMWLHVRVLAEDGRVLFESGDLDEHGEIRDGAARFGAITLDAQGRKTFKPWEAVSFGWKRLVPPKGSTRDTFRCALPTDAGAVTIDARLHYRIAPPHVVRELLGEAAFVPQIVEMARAERSFAAR
ncbi:MAG: hypothetical protein L6Q99_21155 [Planctomycetes bacterium]|nr:hypothetical protein [Planctomycetota bacterium]